MQQRESLKFQVEPKGIEPSTSKVRFYFKVRKFNDLAELTTQNRAKCRTIRNLSATNKM